MDQGVEILIVDVRNMKDKTEEVIAEASVSTPVLLDDQDISHEKYDILATPTTFIVDTTGKAIFKHIGYVEGHEHMLEKEIELLLERRPT
jgi:thioredoxin-related protein